MASSLFTGLDSDATPGLGQANGQPASDPDVTSNQLATAKLQANSGEQESALPFNTPNHIRPPYPHRRQPNDVQPPFNPGRDRSDWARVNKGQVNEQIERADSNSSRGRGSTNSPEQRVAELKSWAMEGNEDAKLALTLGQALEEPNVLALQRFIYLFGKELVRAKAEQARSLYHTGQAEGPSAYQPSPNGTPLAVHSGIARSLGGVFFYLMRQHATSLGLNYEALFIPKMSSIRPPRAPKSAKVETYSSEPIPQWGEEGAAGQPYSSTKVTLSTAATDDVSSFETARATSLPDASASQLQPATNTTQAQALGDPAHQVAQAAHPPTRPRTAPGSAPGRPSHPSVTTGRLNRPAPTPDYNSNRSSASGMQPPGPAPSLAQPRPSSSPNTSSNQSQPATTNAPPPVASSQPFVKPGRLKATVIGVLSRPPTLNPQNRAGLVELVVETEMSASLPKGLPNLGPTKVLVWCTERQFKPVRESLSRESENRLIIEGELAGAVSTDLTPFVRLICLRLTTTELEQARRMLSSNRSDAPSSIEQTQTSPNK